MALSKVKTQVANQFAAVLETLDEKNPLDQNILRNVHALLKSLCESAAAQGDEMEEAVEDESELEIDGEGEGDEGEAVGDDDEVSFDDEEEAAEDDGELEIDGDDEEAAEDDDEVSFDDDEEAAEDDEVSFDEEEEPAPKPSRKPAAAAAAAPAVEEVDYAGMSGTDLYKHLVGRGVDEAYAKKIATTKKKDGLVTLAKNIDKLKALWIKNPIFKKPVAAIEKFVTTKQGIDQPGYGRGRSSEDKKKGILAEALAVAMKKPA